MVRIIPRNSITAFSMSLFDSSSPFIASSVVTLCFAHFSCTISERDDYKLGVAQRDLTVTKQVNELRHPLDCPRFLDSLFQRNAAHDVLMSVFLHRNVSY